MLKQVLAVAVVGLLGTGCASAHDSNWGYRDTAPQAYHSSAFYYYANPRYAPIRYAPRYCPPQRWGWHSGYHGQYPRGYQNNWYGQNNWHGRHDRHDYDRDDHDGGNDWNRHH